MQDEFLKMKFSNTLIHWYLQNQRDLPWRKTTNPYFIWLSEIMLQQTRVAQGLDYYLKFTAAFPTVFDLANASEQTVLKMWQGLGYYSRARNLHFSAKHIAHELSGVFPDNYVDLKKLKGVGDYTAAAIASICFQEATAVVDGNVYRVLARYFGIDTPINSTMGVKTFKLLAQELLSKEQPAMHNQAIMDFGALHCKPQNPHCATCPFQDSCVAFEKKTVKNLPVKEKKLKIKHRYFNYLVVQTSQQNTLLHQRTGKGIWQGMYEFPLLETTEKIEETTLVEAPLYQELFPMNTRLSLFHPVEVVHKLSHQHLHTQFWVVQVADHPQAIVPWKAVEQYPVPVLIANFLNSFALKK